MVNLVVAMGYVVIGGFSLGAIAWAYVLLCVKKSKKLITLNMGNYSEEEQVVIQNFIDDCLNKLK